MTAENEQDSIGIGIRNIYLKDASFEAPNTPYIFNDPEQPDIDVNIGIDTQELEHGFVEVVISVTITAKIKDKTAFLVEVHQGGVFEIETDDEELRAGIIGSFCPQQLFPYARESVATIITKGGFPPLLLDPIDFDQMYQQQAAGEAGQVQH